jgi:hypothetical protein
MSEIISMKNVQKRVSFVDQMKKKTSSQDFSQKMNVFTSLMLELYRALMGAFLVIFVPQVCDNHICSIQENIDRTDIISQTALICNFMTLLSFLVLYFIEVKRENKLITYLEVNHFTPTDNDTVEISLTKLAIDKKQSIWLYDRYYQISGYVSTIIFIINTIVSSIVIYDNYLDNKTLTVYLTNILFMGFKVSDVFNTVNTEKNIFYSAYLKNKVQFNDVDPDKVLQIESYISDVEEIEEIKNEEIKFEEIKME